MHIQLQSSRFLKLQSNEEKRQVGLLQKDLPNKEALDEELKALQTQLTQCQNRLIDLETQVKNSDNTDRVNFLEGKDESPEEVVKKLEVLENKLAIKEEQCLEKYQKQSQEEEIKQHLLPGGIITTAEPRPNAYMPQDDNELPIPRPYGKAAPFKPATNGSNMRHIKKPNPKPIEI